MDDVAVGRLMTSPVLTVEAPTPVAEIAKGMLEAEINSIVVIDEDCRPEGILTSTDFVRLAAEGRDPTATTVGDAMTPDVVTVAPDTEVPTAADRMAEAGVGHLPVVADGGVTGILTATDLTAHLAGRRPAGAES